MCLVGVQCGLANNYSNTHNTACHYTVNMIVIINHLTYIQTTSFLSQNNTVSLQNKTLYLQIKTTEKQQTAQESDTDMYFTSINNCIVSLLGSLREMTRKLSVNTAPARLDVSLPCCAFSQTVSRLGSPNKQRNREIIIYIYK